MGRKIKALAARELRGKLEPFEFNAGELGPEQVEIKVSHCGICHSDLSMRDNEWQMTVYPFVPGYEAVGKEEPYRIRACLIMKDVVSGQHRDFG
jgi:alcohol/geraniol dehydrogenase (NADP+)